MKYRLCFFSFVILLLAISIFTISHEVQAEESSPNQEPQITVFDENGQEIPYKEDSQLNELINMNDRNLLNSWNIYPFGKTEFRYNISIGGGRTFYNPGVVILDAGSGFVRDMSVYLLNSSGIEREYRLKGPWSGTTAVHISPRGYFRIQLVNKNSDFPVFLDGGEVWYK